MSTGDTPTRAQLYAGAAACYGRAGLPAPAVRCLEQAGDWSGAALMHRHARAWGRAADCHERAGQWSAAAECHLNADQPSAAARCMDSAGDPLGAAWVLAHLAHSPAQARALLDRPAPKPADGTPAADPAAADLVLARTLAERDPQEAARILRHVSAGLAEAAPAEPGPGRERLLDWAHTLAGEVLLRPDLTAELHAAAHRAGLPESLRRWEAWAHAELGDSGGVPEGGTESETLAEAESLP
jgi:hypothetical protein